MLNVTIDNKEYEVRFRYDAVRYNNRGEIVYPTRTGPDIVYDRSRVACSVSLRIRVHGIIRHIEDPNDAGMMIDVKAKNGYVAVPITSGLAYLHPGEPNARKLGRAVAFERAIGWFSEQDRQVFRNAYRIMALWKPDPPKLSVKANRPSRAGVAVKRAVRKVKKAVKKGGK